MTREIQKGEEGETQKEIEEEWPPDKQMTSEWTIA
jgi:hypothetical protein